MDRTLQVSHTCACFPRYPSHSLLMSCVPPGTIAGSVNLATDSSPSAFRNNGIAGASSLGASGKPTIFMRLFSQSSYLFFQLAVLRSSSRQDAHGIQCVFWVTRVQDIQNKMDANSCFAAGLSAGCTAIFCFLLLSLVCLLLNVVTLLWRRQRLVSAR